MHDGDEDIEMVNSEGVPRNENTPGSNNGAPTNPGLITEEMDREHIIEQEYFTDELDSGADEDSSDERSTMIRFNEEETLTKDFKFKVGMEFSSLKQFKKAVMEHNVLNGREVTFAKNDANRCRVVCTQKKLCDYTILCSR